MATLFVALNPLSRAHVYIEHAQRKIPYMCIDCNSRLIARLGSKRVFHFAHKSKSTCKGETSSHIYCKHLLRRNICKIKFLSTCIKCNQQQTRQFKEPIETRVEHPWNSYMIDVAVLEPSNSVMLGALEVYHTHRTTQTKMMDLIRNGIFVTDIDTTEILSIFTTDSDEYVLRCSHICIECYQSREQKRIKNLERKRCICSVCDKEFHCTKLFGRTICSRTCYEHILMQQWRAYQQKLRQLHEESERLRQKKWNDYQHVLYKLHETRENRYRAIWTSYQQNLYDLHEMRVQAIIRRWTLYQRKLRELHVARVQHEQSIIRRWNTYQDTLMSLHKKRVRMMCMHCGCMNVSIILDNYLFLCSTQCYQAYLHKVMQKPIYYNTL